MSIASEITRLQGVKSDILTAIADKGVTVPADSALDDCPGLIASIPTGGGSIPDEYQRVLYLEINGTGDPSISNVCTLKFSDKLCMTYQIAVEQTDGAKYYCLAMRSYNGDKEIRVANIKNAEGLTYRFNTKIVIPNNEIQINFDTFQEFLQITTYADDSKTYAIINGQTASINAVDTHDASLILFHYNNFGNYTGTKFFGCQVYDGNSDTLIHNIVPVYRKSDSKPGIYDTVAGRWWSRTGTYTTVNVGPAVY